MPPPAHCTPGGAQVVLVDLPSSDGQNAASAIGSGAHFVAADVTSADDVAAAMDFAATLGSVRVVVNCAGVATPERSSAARVCCRWTHSNASSAST